MNKPLVTVLWVVSIALMVVRLLFIGSTMVIDDEAYYLMYARHLDWGYIDHGPVIAVVIRIFTELLGENGFAIRLAGPLMIGTLGLVLYRFGKKQFSTVTGVTLSLTVTANMLTHTSSVVITPDTPMVFFLILAMVMYYRAFFENRRHFVIAGLLLGLAVLSKISAVFPALGIALFPVFSKNHRRSLKDWLFYLSFVIAVAAVMPFIVWNIQHDLAFIRYQGSHVARSGGIGSFLELWGGLAILTGPVFFFYAVLVPVALTLRKRLGSAGPWQLFFGVVAFVPLAYFAVHSFFSRFELNWPAPALCGGIFLFGIAMGEAWQRKKRLFEVQVGYSLVLIAVVTLQTYLPVLPLRGKNDPTNRYYHYTAFKDDLDSVLSEYPDVAGFRIVANNYQIPSMVNLYNKPKKEAVCLSIGYHETLYGFLYPDETLVGQDFVVIGEEENFPYALREYFDSYVKIGEIQSMRRGKPVETFRVWRAVNYAGKG